MMGGSANPENIVRKARDKTKAEVKRQGAEGIARAAGSIFTPMTGGELGSKAFRDVTGIKADALFNPVGVAGGEVGEKFYDKPKKAKEEVKKLAKAAQAEQEKMLGDIRSRERQASAESEAAESLTKARRRQSRKSPGRGRGSTILTDKLGGSGGQSSEGRKLLLGL